MYHVLKMGRVVGVSRRSSLLIVTLLCALITNKYLSNAAESTVSTRKLTIKSLQNHIDYNSRNFRCLDPFGSPIEIGEPGSLIEFELEFAHTHDYRQPFTLL